MAPTCGYAVTSRVRALDEDVSARFRDVLGADVRAGETLRRYQQTLGAEHPDVRAMARGMRLVFVFVSEPSPF
jgi:hypothetical protein